MKRTRFGVTFLIMLSMSLPIIPFDAAAGDGVVRLCAAGSLRPAFTEIIAAFQKAQGIKVEPTFGASGLLRERLASGEQGDLFASADMGQPLALQAAGKAGPVVLFARNRLCALVRPNLDVTSQTLLSAIPAPALLIVDFDKHVGNARAWRDTLGDQLPDLEIRIGPDAGNLADIEYLAFMHPDFDSLPVFPNLKAMFSRSREGRLKLRLRRGGICAVRSDRLRR